MSLVCRTYMWRCKESQRRQQEEVAEEVGAHVHKYTTLEVEPNLTSSACTSRKTHVDAIIVTLLQKISKTNMISYRGLPLWDFYLWVNEDLLTFRVRNLTSGGILFDISDWELGYPDFQI